jgi:hypothetical protein
VFVLAPCCCCSLDGYRNDAGTTAAEGELRGDVTLDVEYVDVDGGADDDVDGPSWRKYTRTPCYSDQRTHSLE